MTITAAVDGSALGNPGPAGWAWVVSPDAWAAGGFKRATNNVGELTALLRLLQDTAEAGFAGEPLVVLADSQYVINSVTKWMAGWKRRGWKKADGKPVLNREILEQIDRALSGRDVHFEWVKGHAGHDLNEAADLRARAAAEAHRDGSQVPTGPAFTETMASRTALGARTARRNIAGARGGGRPENRASGTAGTGTGGAGNPGNAGRATSAGSMRPQGTPFDAGPYGLSVGELEPQGAPHAGLDSDPIVAISATQAPQRWEDVLASAHLDPVTITQSGKPSLLLLDADTAWKALALLDEIGERSEGTLF